MGDSCEYLTFASRDALHGLWAVARFAARKISGQDLGGNGLAQISFSRRDRADRQHQFGAIRFLEDIAVCAGIERRADVLLAIVRREHQLACARRDVADLCEQFETRNSRKGEIHEHQIRLQLADTRQAGCRIAEISRDFEVRLQVDERLEPLAQDFMIFHEDDADSKVRDAGDGRTHFNHGGHESTDSRKECGLFSMAGDSLRFSLNCWIIVLREPHKQPMRHNISRLPKRGPWPWGLPAESQPCVPLNSLL